MDHVLIAALTSLLLFGTSLVLYTIMPCVWIISNSIIHLPVLTSCDDDDI